jgi:hypothetical protein
MTYRAPVAVATVFADRPLSQTSRGRCPHRLQNASLRSGLDTRGIELLQRVDRCCCNHPHMPPIGRRERAISLCADAWPPRPRTAQPNLNRSDTPPIPTEYTASNRPHTGTLTSSLARAPSA